MKLEIDKSPPKDDWDAVLKKRGEGDYRQCYEYGESVKQGDSSMGVVRFLARIDGPVGVLQGVYGKRPFSRLLLGGSSGGGPVLIPLSDKDGRKVGLSLLSSAVEFARKNLLSTSRIHRFKRHGLLDVMDEMGFTLSRESKIFFVRLSSDPSYIWTMMESSKRRNLRHAKDRGVDVRVSTERRDLDLFYDMFVDFSRSRSFQPFSRAHIESLWDAFSRTDLIRVFIAEMDGLAVASALVLNHLDTAFCPYTCSREEARQARANDLLHWDIIRWGCRSGLSRYSMGEVFPDSTSSQYGLYRWKKGFSGYLDTIAILDAQLLPTVQRFKALIPLLGSRKG